MTVIRLNQTLQTKESYSLCELLFWVIDENGEIKKSSIGFAIFNAAGQVGEIYLSLKGAQAKFDDLINSKPKPGHPT